jgi:ubiquinone/menaquinone biosynthesis C-methylase UbiE
MRQIDFETAPSYQILATAGKKVLRPGGRSATKQLLRWANFQPGEKVLELASSFGENAIAMARQYQVKVVGLERNPDSVRLARANIAAAGLSDQIEIMEGNVLQLDRLQGKFDYILAEAILSMQSASGKAKILRDIRDRLQPTGRFLSHELMARHRETEIHEVLSATIRANVTPLSGVHWIAACQDVGLIVRQDQIGAMKLLNPWQMLQDKGTKAMLRFIWNFCTQVLLRQQVLAMLYVFFQYRDDLGYIIMTASLPIESAGETIQDSCQIGSLNYQ